jgi:prepilin-type processing-associated H-X9-DG protein
MDQSCADALFDELADRWNSQMLFLSGQPGFSHTFEKSAERTVHDSAMNGGGESASEKNAIAPVRRPSHKPGRSRAVRPGCKSISNQRGLTLIEVLVLVAILGVMAGLLLPALAKARTRARGTTCLDNMKRLQLGWALYSADNSGKLIPSGGVDTVVVEPADPEAQPGGRKSQWVLGTIQSAGSTDVRLLQAGLLYPYVNNTAVYKCPADRRTDRWNVAGLRVESGGTATVRSISMNCWLNPISFGKSTGWRIMRNQADIAILGPAGRWVFIDEDPWSINDGSFECDPGQPSWVDQPATYHNAGSGISFADGHSEIKQWRDPELQRLPMGVKHSQSPFPEDLSWLQERSTSRE